MVARLVPGGALVVGSREQMPDGIAGLEPRIPGIFTVRQTETVVARGRTQ